MRVETIGVYVHFPYCLKKCPYCDFVSFARARDDIDHRGYADAVIAEVQRRAPSALAGKRVESVFFGGGTPSLWASSELGRVLRAILAETGARADDVEVTVECNPTSLDAEKARALIDVGVNRVSIGVQALDAERLAFLGRLHDAEGGLLAVEAALRAGVPRVSADLIYGVATASGPPKPSDSVAEVLRVARTGVTHLSAYSLTIEPATQFGELAKRGRLPIAPDDTVADAFLAIEDALVAEGFAHYEISNYARPGCEARHNVGYWLGADYLGLGCGAFGTLSTTGGSAVRYRNIAEPARYVTSSASGASTASTTPHEDAVVDSTEALDPETRLRERLMLGLRLIGGFDLGAAAVGLGVPPWTRERERAARRLEGRGQLEIDGDHLRIPRRARVYADGIASALF